MSCFLILLQMENLSQQVLSMIVAIFQNQNVNNSVTTLAMNGFYMPIELEIDCFQHKIVKFGKSPDLGLAGGWGITNMILPCFLHFTCEYFSNDVDFTLALHTKRILNLSGSSQNKEVLIFVA